MELMKDDLNFVASRIPRDIREIMKERGLFLAGGFIRSTVAGERPSDIDLFGPTKERLENCALILTTDRKGRFHASDNAFTVLSPPRMPVQFIHRWLYEFNQEGAERLIAEFDFTIAQAMIWRDEHGWKSLISDRFYADLAARRLVYTFPQRAEDAGGSLLRVRKFLSKGYNIQAPSLGGVVARISMAVRWNDLYESDGQTVEWMAAKVITGLIREVDPMAIVDGIDTIDEHEVVAEDKS